MTAKKLISAATLGFLLTAGVAAAQTTYPTTNTGSTNTTGTTDTTGTTNAGSTTGTTVPGTPNTGAGGDAGSDVLVPGTSSVIALAGAAYLAYLTRRQRMTL